MMLTNTTFSSSMDMSQRSRMMTGSTIQLANLKTAERRWSRTKEVTDVRTVTWLIVTSIPLTCSAPVSLTSQIRFTWTLLVTRELHWWGWAQRLSESSRRPMTRQQYRGTLMTFCSRSSTSWWKESMNITMERTRWGTSPSRSSLIMFRWRTRHSSVDLDSIRTWMPSRTLKWTE